MTQIVIPPQPTEPSEPELEVMSVAEADLIEGCKEYEILSATEVRHDYIYASGKLMRETITTTVDGTVTDTEVLDFFYDTNGRPYAFKYDGTVYYYVLNLQGDVIRIVNESGTTLQSYSYNAWGEPINTVSSKVGKLNPLRYRGYCYDTETGFYYLQSRYYDPVIRRFINADVYSSTDTGFLGYNMFAYCNNSPVSNKDSEGTFLTTALTFGAKILTDGLAGGLIGAATNAICAFSVNGEVTWSDIGEGFRDGFIGGALGKFSWAYNVITAVKTTKECMDSGASFGASLTAGLVSLWAGAAFSDAKLGTVGEAVFGLGLSLVSTGVTEAVQRRGAGKSQKSQSSQSTVSHNSSNRRSVSPARHATPKTTRGGNPNSPRCVALVQ